MLSLWRFRKTAAVIAGAGATVVLVGAIASANGGAGGSQSVQSCDPNVSNDCVSVFSPVIRKFEKPDFTPSISQDITLTSDARPYTTIIRMDGIPNGFYKFEANGFLDDAADPLSSDEGPTDWQCQLVLQNADNVNPVVLDYWESEKLDDATYFLKAAVNLNVSGVADPTSSVYVRCNSGARLWKAAWQKIIAVDAADLLPMNGS